jgi:hypothetical protein
VAGEDVEDQLRAVKDAAGQSGLKVAELRGREVVVKEDQVGLVGCGYGCNLFNLAGADERGGIGLGTALEELGDDMASGAGDQFAKLGERFASIEIAAARGAGRHGGTRQRDAGGAGNWHVDGGGLFARGGFRAQLTCPCSFCRCTAATRAPAKGDANQNGAFLPAWPAVCFRHCAHWLTMRPG